MRRFIISLCALLLQGDICSPAKITSKTAVPSPTRQELVIEQTPSLEMSKTTEPTLLSRYTQTSSPDSESDSLESTVQEKLADAKYRIMNEGDQLDYVAAATSLMEACQVIYDNPQLLEDHPDLQETLAYVFLNREQVLDYVDTGDSYVQQEEAFKCNSHALYGITGDEHEAQLQELCYRQEMDLAEGVYFACAEAVAQMPCRGTLSAQLTSVYAKVLKAQDPATVERALGTCGYKKRAEMQNLLSFMTSDSELQNKLGWLQK